MLNQFTQLSGQRHSEFVVSTKSSFRGFDVVTKVTPLRLEDDTVIYIEVTENVEALPPTSAPLASSEKGDEDTEEAPIKKGNYRKQMVQNFQAIQGTIRAYTLYTLNSFRKVAIANVDKVTLEFGIEVGGEGGIPYITKGTAKSNLKITAECSFHNNSDQHS